MESHPLPHCRTRMTSIIDDETGCSLRRADRRGLALHRLEQTIELRDLHLIQDVLEVRQAVDLHGPDRPGTALAFAIILNNSLPPRLRLADAEAEAFMRPYEIMPKRQLLKTLYRAWREIGAPRRRGWMYPPRRWGHRFLATAFDIGADVLAERRYCIRPRRRTECTPQGRIWSQGGCLTGRSEREFSGLPWLERQFAASDRNIPARARVLRSDSSDTCV